MAEARVCLLRVFQKPGRITSRSSFSVLTPHLRVGDRSDRSEDFNFYLVVGQWDAALGTVDSEGRILRLARVSVHQRMYLDEEARTEVCYQTNVKLVFQKLV